MPASNALFFYCETPGDPGGWCILNKKLEPGLQVAVILLLGLFFQAEDGILRSLVAQQDQSRYGLLHYRQAFFPEELNHQRKKLEQAVQGIADQHSSYCSTKGDHNRFEIQEHPDPSTQKHCRDQQCETTDDANAGRHDFLPSERSPSVLKTTSQTGLSSSRYNSQIAISA